MKKVYCFYLVVDEEEVDDYHACDEYDWKKISPLAIILYAFTPDKEMAKYFRNTRNMKKFYEKVYKFETSAEYNDFYNKYNHYILEYHGFVSKKIENGIYKSTMENIICTAGEAGCILYYKEEYLIDELEQVLTDPVIEMLTKVKFKDKLSKILNDLFLLSSVCNKIEPLEDINYDELNIDELSLYIRLFSNTLNNKGDD